MQSISTQNGGLMPEIIENRFRGEKGNCLEALTWVRCINNKIKKREAAIT